MVQIVKNLPCNAGDWASIPQSGRSPGERKATQPSIAWRIPHGHLEPAGTVSLVHGVEKNQTRLSH